MIRAAALGAVLAIAALSGASVWHRAQIAAAVAEARAGWVTQAALSAAEAGRDRANRMLAAERAARSGLEASAAEAERETTAALAELEAYMMEHPDAPAHCTVSDALARRLSRLRP